MTSAQPTADDADAGGVRYAVRVWLPDRPGALGAVASRIGSLGGDVVGIDIIERDGGLAVDDLLVQLPPDVPLALVCREISEVDEVQVEDVRTLSGGEGDSRLDALAAAVRLAEADDREVEAVLALTARTALAASWAAVVGLTAGTVTSTSGDPPGTAWLVAFARGRLAAGRPGVRTLHPVEEVLAVALGDESALCLGRHPGGATFRPREVEAATLLARLARAGTRP